MAGEWFIALLLFFVPWVKRMFCYYNIRYVATSMIEELDSSRIQNKKKATRDIKTTKLWPLTILQNVILETRTNMVNTWPSEIETFIGLHAKRRDSKVF